MILILKVTLTPLLIAAATLAGRRWGPGVSGWLVGLPLTSGPVSLILAVQHGPGFASAAAVGALGGQASFCVFCLVYAFSAQNLGWAASAAISLAAFFGATFLLSLASLPLWPTTALLVAVIVGVLLVMPRGLAPGNSSGAAASASSASSAPAAQASPPAWDLPARMAIAAAFVIGLTSVSGTLGPRSSGLLSPFPIFGLVLAAFVHGTQGPRAAARLMRGVVIGSFGFAAFFISVALLVTVLPVPLVYGLAACAAVGVNGLTLRAVR